MIHSIPQNSSTAKLGKFIDTKGNGGYVIWAGSKGYRYRDGYDPKSKQVSPMPNDFKECITRAFSVIPIGNRNETLFRQSVSLVNSGVSNEAIKKAASDFKSKV